jgi:hypothetical protein
MRILRTILCVALLLSGLAVVSPITPVSAASPNCNSFSGGPWRVSDGHLVDANLPTFNRNPNCILGQGNTGKAVQVLQIALARCNNADLGSSGADGIYGPITRNIVLFIQAANGITADGVYGPQTLRVLRWPANTGGCWRLNP